MIKVVTAHPRITIVAITGATAVAAFASNELLGISPGDVASQAGTGLSHAYKYVKAAGIAGAILGFLFILFRFKIIAWMAAGENAAFMICRRGRIVRNHKTGEVVLHDNGRNRLHLINYRHLVRIHFGDRFIKLGTHEFTLNGVTWKRSFTLRWRIPRDKKLLERTVTSVSDQNWWDGEFNQLTRAIEETATGQLDPLLREAWIDEKSRTPEFDRKLAERLFGAALEPYGGKFYELIASPVARTDAQQNKDGSLAIADAIASVNTSEQTNPIFGWLKRLL